MARTVVGESFAYRSKNDADTVERVYVTARDDGSVLHNGRRVARVGRSIVGRDHLVHVWYLAD